MFEKIFTCCQTNLLISIILTNSLSDQSSFTSIGNSKTIINQQNNRKVSP